MAEMEWFCIDTRIRDQNGRCVVYHFARTLEDDSIIVQDISFKPYIIITSPFHDAPYDMLRERILSLWNGHRKTQIYMEEQEYIRLDEKITCIKASFDSVEDYFFCKRIISESPERFHELFSRTTLKKKYFVERNLTPLTVWKCDATSFPMNARVKAYQTGNVEQQDSMTYTSPRIMAITLQTSSMLSSFIYDEEPIRSITYSNETGSRTLTWNRTKTVHTKTSYVESEADLIDQAKRSISAEKPAIIAGYSSDDIAYPRLMARANYYSEAQSSARLNISDDFSTPYASRFGISIHGFVHIDTRTTAQNMAVLEAYSHLKTVLEQNHNSAGGGLLHPEGQTDKEQAYSTIVRDAAITMYPFLAELSKLVSESLFDVSRFSSARSFQSYYETQCLKKNHYPEEIVIDSEPYTMPVLGEEAWIEGHSLRQKAIISFPHIASEASISRNISKETYKCKCCRPAEENVREWYCKKSTSCVQQILSGLISDYKKYKELQERIGAGITTAIYAKAACASYLLQGYEKALQTRSNPLYFPQGAEGIERTIRRITSSVREKGIILGARVEKKIFVETADEKVMDEIRRAVNDEIGADALLEKQELIGSIIVKDDKGYISITYMNNDYEIRYAKKTKEFAGLCNFAATAKDIIVQRIIETRSKEEILKLLENKLQSLYDKEYEPYDIIIFTTLYQPLDKYERETLFVKAGRKLEEKKYAVGIGTKIPYIITLEGDDIDATVPFSMEDIETAPIALDQYAIRQVIRAVSPYIKAVHVTPEEIRTIIDNAREKSKWIEKR
jgi:DNA polymerase elongation subunit (family B)